MINIAEILVANVTGALIVLFLLIYKNRTVQSKLLDEKLYNFMLIVTFTALVAETTSFLIDGKIFWGCYILQYILNTICTGAVTLTGFCWSLFVDFRIYRNMARLRAKIPFLMLPFLVASCALFINLFGTGIIFQINDADQYHRGPLSILMYVVVFIYYIESILATYLAKEKNVMPGFFPIFYFVVPCIIGTVIQGMFFGISTGWLSVSVAFILVYVEFQSFNSFIDDLSGLFNRKYMYHYLYHIQKKQPGQLYGIMLDVNDFKIINDTYGHLAGDRAISAIGQILVNSVDNDSVAVRMAGDEFVVFLKKGSRRKLEALKSRIIKNIQHFNKHTSEPFQLSLSLGTAKCHGNDIEKFLTDMDNAMYAVKQQYHADTVR